jgi:hypothetical protein
LTLAFYVVEARPYGSEGVRDQQEQLALTSATFEGMSIRLILILVITGWATSVFGKGADTTSFHRDSAEVVDAVRQVEPWLGDRLTELENGTNPEQARRIAIRIAERTDSLTSRFREVFPDDDDMALYSMYNGLVAAFSCSDPGLAGVYRAVATSYMYSGDEPFRPDYYRALTDIAEQASALAHAKRPERLKRLAGKLHSAYIDLVVAEVSY